ncbi:PH domain-containing protein [Haloglomus litoreum]|uniref:PH domain-containing protein n=1 Tax=Haloglomus litoreum TaxID=3034026 RepID=UPI0023E75A2A|nr:PH domain-containing protein [Haloglomus sp. DT116]
MRLSPLSIPYGAVTTAARLGWILVIATFGSTQMPGAGPLVAVALVAGVLALAGAYQLARWQRFDYELTEDTLDIESGVFSRRTREIPLQRVQNVDTSRNAVQRALGIAAVTVETAGGSDVEAELRYVTEAEAERLRAEVGRLKREHSRDHDAEPGDARATPDDEPAEEELFAMSARELALLGVVSVDLRLLSLFSAIVPILAPSLARSATDPLFSLAVTAPLVAGGLVLLAVLASAAFSVGNFYGFRLSRAGDELRYERGLLNRYTGTVPLSKVQSVVLSENALARRIGYASLTVETAGYAPGDSGAESAVPLARRERAVALAREIEPFGEVTFERPPTRARTRYVIRYALVGALLTAIAYGVHRFSRFAFAWYLVAGLVVLAPLAAHLKWRNLGFAVLDDHVVLRSGFWSRETTVVPYYRVQTVVESQTVFQRRRDLATVVVDTAGSRGLTTGDPQALDIEAERASELRETVADRLQASLQTRRAVRRERGRDRLTSVAD